MALQLETTRLMMKMQAFVRTNASHVLSMKLKSDEDLAEDISDFKKSVQEYRPLASFSTYVYFLFAPTLIYRNEYPRTTHIRWGFAIKRLLEIVAIVFLVAFVFKLLIRKNFGNFGRSEWNLVTFTQNILDIMPTVATIWFCMFYFLQHSWFNFMAEILRFGDRLFYTSWWNASNYDDYYRQWNTVIYEWLYNYVYCDFYEYVFAGSKTAASLMVFTISALFHEIILCCVLRIFFPVLYIFFGVIGFILVIFTRVCSKNAGQLMLWFATVIGSSILVSLYGSEYYARINSIRNSTDWFDYFIPQMIYTYKSS